MSNYYRAMNEDFGDNTEATVNIDNKLTLETIPMFCCKKCGSLDVQERSWSNINTGKICEIIENSEIWCSRCEQETKLGIIKKPINKTITINGTIKPNANLIASAPNLYKALKDILSYFSEYENDYNEKLDCFENARTIIASIEDK